MFDMQQSIFGIDDFSFIYTHSRFGCDVPGEVSARISWLYDWQHLCAERVQNYDAYILLQHLGSQLDGHCHRRRRGGGHFPPRSNFNGSDIMRGRKRREGKEGKWYCWNKSFCVSGVFPARLLKGYIILRIYRKCMTFYTHSSTYSSLKFDNAEKLLQKQKKASYIIDTQILKQSCNAKSAVNLFYTKNVK